MLRLYAKYMRTLLRFNHVIETDYKFFFNLNGFDHGEWTQNAPCELSPRHPPLVLLYSGTPWMCFEVDMQPQE